MSLAAAMSTSRPASGSRGRTRRRRSRGSKSAVRRILDCGLSCSLRSPRFPHVGWIGFHPEGSRGRVGAVCLLPGFGFAWLGLRLRVLSFPPKLCFLDRRSRASAVRKSNWSGRPGAIRWWGFKLDVVAVVGDGAPAKAAIVSSGPNQGSGYLGRRAQAELVCRKLIGGWNGYLQFSQYRPSYFSRQH